MADYEINELDPAGPLSGADFLLIEQGGETFKVTLGALAQWIKTAESIVPSAMPYRGARVRLEEDRNIATTGNETLTWGTEVRDTDNLWSLASPDRFIIPAGISKVKLSAFLRYDAGASNRYLLFTKNNARFQGGASAGQAAAVYDGYIESGVIDVVEGDYFKLVISGSTAVVSSGLTGGTTGTGSWFEIQVIEAV